MALDRDKKLKITPLNSKFAPVAVLFNPPSYRIDKPVTWSSQTNRTINAPTLTFDGGGSRSLTLDLLFDTTEPDGGSTPSDVRSETNKVVELSRIEPKKGQPPVCKVTWGAQPSGSDFPFIGVISNLTQQFTLFQKTGEPVRATLTVVFTEFVDAEYDKRLTDPELTTRVLRRGDTLASIAADVYGNPALWREIARSNDVDDPRELAPGRTLTIPKLR